MNTAEKIRTPAPGFAKHPNHTIDITPSESGYVAAVGDIVIARSKQPLLLEENRYPPVIYFPKEDVDFSYLTPTAHGTHCPFKGDARYWTVTVGDDVHENAAWAYDDPFAEMAPIEGCVAFYTDKVGVRRA